MPTNNDVTDVLVTKIFADPHTAIAYVTAGRGNLDFQVRHIKALFNFAGQPLPADMQSKNDQDTYSVGRLQKANLVFRASRKAGDNIVKSIGYWIKAGL